MTDEALMEEMKGGSEAALQLLHQRYAPLIFALAARSLGRPGAEDLVQEVLLAAWNARGSYDPARGKARPWLLEIAHTRILNELRRRNRHPESDATALEGLHVDDVAPDEQAWRAQRQTVLNAALAELPPAEAQAVRLAFFEELSHSEVAEFLKVPLGTVKTRIRTGIGRLLQRLAPVLGPSLVLLAIAGGLLWALRSDLSRHDRAVRMLSLSDSQTIRLAAAEGVAAETHGTFRWHPGVATAVVTLSHAPAVGEGTRYWAWARIDGRWLKLCELVPDASGRAVAIAEASAVGEPPEQLVVSVEQTPGAEPSGHVIVRWSATAP